LHARRYLFAVIVLLGCCLQGVAQGPGALRERKIPVLPREQSLDTLSIIEDSFTIFGPDSEPLDPVFYRLDHINARITLNVPEFWHNDSLLVRYRVFPVKFTAPYFHKDTALIRPPGPGEDVIGLPLAPPGLAATGLIPSETLMSSGSITRGITMGNRQDVTLNSAMNLQLSGSLSDDIDIVAVISDQDIPFQPDGTTRQIQDFDKVFIRLTGLGGELTAGDFELERPAGHFMNFSRRAQGGMIRYAAQLDTAQGVMPGAALRVTAAGAIAKGKYARNLIPGVEGNQGPYKLTGANNESFIMVLAGTERVFIDGLMLERGMDHDYVIDYNMAEITFTSRRLITRDSRIVVEFEYAERNYARSMFFSGVEMETPKTTLRFNFFSEQDHRNQPLFQELTDERIARMSQVGDSIHLAFDWNADSIGFRNDRVMYRLTDSLGIDTVFVYSIDPDVAVYRVGFTFVGEGRGHYRQVSSAANGRVFQWFAPVNGVPQGTHEPIIQLVTPKKDQLMTLGADHRFTERTSAGMEVAVSNRDLNLFSDLHGQHNTGFAFRVNARNRRDFAGMGDGQWSLNLTGSHEYAESSFSPLERYRPVEFERDWNLGLSPPAANEHFSLAEIHLQHPQAGNVRYRFHALMRETHYQGLLNSMDAGVRVGRNRVYYEGGLLASDGQRQTTFYRHRAGISRPLLRWVAGFDHHTENNRIFDQLVDTLSPVSFAFDEWQVFVTNPDTAVNRYRLFYKVRHDRLPQQSAFRDAANARDIGASWELLQNPNQRLHINAVHRSLNLRQPDGTPDDENTLAGRIDYFSRWGKGWLTSAVFYEAGSGMERQREYIYLEVPAGQGVYTWIDYNGNGIMELDEFEIAQFPDQANFIRVFVPTDDFIRTFSTIYSHTLNLDPAVVWRDAAGLRNFLARFYNQMSFRIDRKTQGGTTASRFNPFEYNLRDTALVALNAAFRNTLFFNRANPVFGAELNLQDNRNKMLLSNGFETRVLQNAGIRTRWNITRQYSINLSFSGGVRENRSEFFLNRNYRIRQYDLEPMVSYQAAGRHRLSLFVGYAHKENGFSAENEIAATARLGAEARYSAPGRSTLNARYQLSRIDFPHPENTPVAFEMLEGLRPGTNHLWNVSWQQNLNAWLQLNLSYHGRKPPDVNAIHTGSMQLRALF
jgi:hypothetical protein